MITLEDALNRNFYFYQGSGEVRIDFVKQIFFDFLGYDFQSFMSNKIKVHLDKGLPRSKAMERAAHQAVETCLRSCEAILKYRKEIKEKFHQEPGLRGGITDKQIDEMRYTDLKTLRTNLGLSRRGKKVTEITQAPERTVQEARANLSKQKTSETIASIYTSNISSDQQDLDDGSYTLAEISEIVGYDITAEEAIALGYHLDNPSERYSERIAPEPLPEPRTPTKEELIAAINEELPKMSREDVENFYWYIQDKKLHKSGHTK